MREKGTHEQRCCRYNEEMSVFPQFRQDLILLFFFFVLGAALSVLDHRLGLGGLLIEGLHLGVVSLIFVFCLVSQYRYPEIKQFGWHKILWGLGLLMLGTFCDFLDNPPIVAFLQSIQIPYSKNWEEAFVEKIIGYSAGIGLTAFGFFQWVPWMISTRMNVEKLNQTISSANKELRDILINLDERIEAERLNISRELHDDVAQQLTFLGYQLQLCQKTLAKSPQQAEEQLKAIGSEVSDVLKSVRQISRELRPEPLYALGFIAALEQFIEKTRQQVPEMQMTLHYQPLPNEAETVRFETRFNDRELLHLYRLLQESIRNALKHSQAKQIEVSILEETHQFKFVIEDDGVGLPWEKLPTDDVLINLGHLGIAGMKERVQELGGSFQITSQPPHGARTEIVIQK